MTVPKASLDAAFEEIDEGWTPAKAGELNGQALKVARVTDASVWQEHRDHDRLYLVRSGTLRVEFDDDEIELGEGEFTVVPRETRHRPVAEEPTDLVLFEPAGGKGGVAPGLTERFSGSSE